MAKTKYLRPKTGVQLKPVGETDLRHVDAGEPVEVDEKMGVELIQGERAEEHTSAEHGKHVAAWQAKQKKAAAEEEKKEEKK